MTRRAGKVLVLGHGSRSFLAVIRSLGRGGLDVHVAWESPGAVALGSRYVSRIHRIATYDGRDTSWKAELINLMQRERFDLVVPCDDVGVTALQEHGDDLEPYGRLCRVSQASYEILFDKIRTNELARSVGCPVPREEVVHDLSQGADLDTQFGLPIVLKPRRSFNPNDPDSKNLVRKAYTSGAYHELLQDMLKVGPVIVQQNVTGRGVGVELLLEKGQPLLTFQHERVHEPLLGGGSSYRKSVAVTPVLLDASVRLLSALSYTGVAMVEFKVDADAGVWFLMEVNARFWGSLPLALAAGVDFPVALYRLLVDGYAPPPATYRANVHCRNLSRDTEWLIANLKADRTDPTLATRPLRSVVAGFVSNLLLLREHVDSFAIDDPRPFLLEVSGLARSAARSLADSTMDHVLKSRLFRKRIARTAERAVRDADRVLFVCKGNICRSPFAEGLARRLDVFPVVESAGYYPEEDRQSPEHAVQAARHWGIDLSSHRSRVITEASVRAADAVFVFDRGNKARVARDFPIAKDRIHLVGALQPAKGLSIADPWGGDSESFRSAYSQIGAAITVMKRLRASPSSPRK